MLDREKWTGLVYQGKDYSKFFSISNFGRFKNVKTNKIRKTSIGYDGYEHVYVTLGSRKNKKAFNIHKAVLESFSNKQENKPYINHKDGNKLNNRLENLEWCSQSENLRHALKNGKINVKLNDEAVMFIRENYIPRDIEYGCTALAKKYGVACAQISRVVNNKSWKHVK